MIMTDRRSTTLDDSSRPAPVRRNATEPRYVYRAIDQFGQVIDVFVSARQDATAARRFFERAIGSTKVRPAEVTTDQAPVYPTLMEELLPAAWHHTDRYANNRVEADHGRLKAPATNARTQARP